MQLKERISAKIYGLAKNISQVAEDTEEDYKIPIVNRQISITPISMVIGGLPVIQEISLEKMQEYNDPLTRASIVRPIVSEESINACVEVAQTLDEIAKNVNVDFLGGFSALVQKGFTHAELCVLQSLPEVLSQTERVCASVNVGTTKSGFEYERG